MGKKKVLAAAVGVVIGVLTLRKLRGGDEPDDEPDADV